MTMVVSGERTMMDSESAVRITCRVIGLHCAEEVAVLRRALGRHAGVADVHVDQIRAEVSFALGEPATFASVSSAVSRAGLRLVQPGERERDAGVDRRLWWAGWTGVGLLLVAAALQFVFSGGDWLTLVADSEEAPLPLPVLLAYGLAAVASGVVILPRAWSSLRHAHLDMHVLVVIAACGATWLGEISEAAMVAGLFAGAQLLEGWSAARARRAVGSLMQGGAPSTCCRMDGRDRQVALDAIVPGMVLVIRPGERIPVDGEVVGGHSSIDESALTGEPTYVRCGVGDRVPAGAINGSGCLEIQAHTPVDGSALGRMLAAVEQQRRSRTRAERSVETFARVYTPLVVGLALLVWLVPPLLELGTFEDWFRRGLVVTLVACPCALVISTPLTVVAGLAAAARAGVLVKGGDHLERCASFDVVAFDKTGVTTTGRPQVVRFQAFDPFTERRTLEQVAALEARSEHPLAVALIDFAASRGIVLSAAHGRDVQAVPGLGLEGEVGGQPFWVGSARFLERHVNPTPVVTDAITALRQQGLTVVACGSGLEVWAIFGARDETRADAVEAARALRLRGVRRLALLSGDHPAAVRATAERMEVDDVRGECTPEEKARAVEDLARHGTIVMVGDGINDVPALAAATLGIAAGPRATDAALEAADIVFVHDDLRRLPWLVDHARRTLAVVRQNLWIAITLKVAFIVAATGGHAALWMAVLADTGATLLVTVNGLRMLRATKGAGGTGACGRQHQHHHQHPHPPHAHAPAVAAVRQGDAGR